MNISGSVWQIGCLPTQQTLMKKASFPAFGLKRPQKIEQQIYLHYGSRSLQAGVECMEDGLNNQLQLSRCLLFHCGIMLDVRKSNPTPQYALKTFVECWALQQ